MNSQQCEMSPDPSQFLSHHLYFSLPSTFSLKLWLASTFFFLLTTNNIPSTWNCFLCNRSRKRRRVVIRKIPLLVGAWAHALEFGVCATATVGLWLGRAAVCRHGSVRSSMSIMLSVMGVPISNISESSAALPEKIAIIGWVTKTWDTKHIRKI